MLPVAVIIGSILLVVIVILVDALDMKTRDGAPRRCVLFGHKIYGYSSMELDRVRGTVYEKEVDTCRRVGCHFVNVVKNTFPDKSDDLLCDDG